MTSDTHITFVTRLQLLKACIKAALVADHIILTYSKDNSNVSSVTRVGDRVDLVFLTNELVRRVMA